MKAALIQLCAGPDKESNLRRAKALSQEALSKGAKLVLFPEVFNFRGDTRNKEILAAASEKIPGLTSHTFVPQAQQYKAAFLLGSILEKGPQDKAYNTSIFIDTGGKITAKYRKIHLFDARINDKIVREADCFWAGKTPATVEVEGFKMGLSICYDLRFPGLYQEYARQSADVMAVPSCFTQKTGEAHWEVLLRARAIETLSYVLAPNQVGSDARGMQAYGHSMIVSPWGEIIARGSASGEEIVYGDIHREEVLKARKVLPGIIN